MLRRNLTFHSALIKLALSTRRKALADSEVIVIRQIKALKNCRGGVYLLAESVQQLENE